MLKGSPQSSVQPGWLSPLDALCNQHAALVVTEAISFAVMTSDAGLVKSLAKLLILMAIKDEGVAGMIAEGLLQVCVPCILQCLSAYVHSPTTSH